LFCRAVKGLLNQARPVEQALIHQRNVRAGIKVRHRSAAPTALCAMAIQAGPGAILKRRLPSALKPVDPESAPVRPANGWFHPVTIARKFCAGIVRAEISKTSDW
jgi:hypothetical protein